MDAAGGGGYVYSSRGNSRTLALSDSPKTEQFSEIMTKLQFCDNSCILPNVSVRGRRGRAVWALDLQFEAPAFKSRPDS